MNDEIKEILDYLKNDFYVYGEIYTEEKCKVVAKKENHQLLDYITNLQKENADNINRIHELKEYYDMKNKLIRLNNRLNDLKDTFNSLKYLERDMKEHSIMYETSKLVIEILEYTLNGGE